MKLKKLLKVIDPVGMKINIWDQYEDNHKPLFEGDLDEVPWTLTEYEINENVSEPVYFVPVTNEYGAKLTLMIVNIIEKE